MDEEKNRIKREITEAFLNLNKAALSLAKATNEASKTMLFFSKLFLGKEAAYELDQLRKSADDYNRLLNG